MSQPCGHVDFYPNNGKEQPGCDIAENPIPLTLIKEGLEEASRVLLACNHVRAVKLFSDSINSKCQYMAHQCDSYDHYMQVQNFKKKIRKIRVDNESFFTKL
jgi:pancreatic triacylglycerol lipase